MNPLCPAVGYKKLMTTHRMINQYMVDEVTPLDRRLSERQEQLPRAQFKPKRNQKQFCCPVSGCPANYTRRHNLKTHFRNNHKGFETKFPGIFATLKSTKEGKKWKCPVQDCICGYSRKGDLKHHFALKHPSQVEMYPDICKPKSSKDNKNYLCPMTQCNCGYMRKSDLKNHISLKHPEEMHLYPELLPRSVSENQYQNDDVSAYELHSAQESDHSGFEVQDEDDDEEFDGRSMSDETDTSTTSAYYTRRRHAGSSLVNRSTLLESKRPYVTCWTGMSPEEINVASCLALLASKQSAT